MVTTRIQIKPHLKEYISGKYNEFSDRQVTFPDNLDIYHMIFNLTEKRPRGCPLDFGNLEIILPDRYGAKHPETYNYLGVRSQKIIERKIEVMFWADFREYVDFEHQTRGIPYIEAICTFIRKYGIRSISEDALQKNYYRWRKKVRNHEKRAYKTKKFQ
jgi:hypothetical protein